MAQVQPQRMSRLNTVINANSLHIPLLSNSVDLVLTSPPYPGATMWSLPGETIEDNIKRLTALNLGVLSEAARIVRKNGCIAWNIADIPYGDHGVIQNTSTVTHFAAQELGLKWRNHVVWDKGSSHLPPPTFMRRPCVIGLSHEHVYVWFKGGWVPREKKINLAKHDRRWAAFSVWKISPKRDDKHIAPFPYELARRCVELWSLPGELVVDPFSGSGTVGQVCRDTKRRFLGLELDEQYCIDSVFNIHKRAVTQSAAVLGPLFGGENDQETLWEDQQEPSED